MNTTTHHNDSSDARKHQLAGGANARFFSLALSLFVLTALAQPLLALPGAIWTTDIDLAVNINHYPTKQDVYLNGGPRSSNSPGLPDGLYHVKITEPNGTVLGTSSGGPPPINVVDGRVTQGPGPRVPYKVWDIVKKTSDNTTGYDDTTNNGGVYKAWLSKDSTFPNWASKTDNFKAGPSNPEPIFGIIEVFKFYDSNADGIRQGDEVLLENWMIKVARGATCTDRFTTLKEDFIPGDYVVTERIADQPNWFATTELSASFTLTENGVETLFFGNHCLGEGGGKTLGFWSNKNGQAKMNDGGSMVSELALLTEKNLRNANGSNFDPANYTAFRNWILSANATNMAFMLSAQFAAMTLNVEGELVNPGWMIYAPGTGSANPLGYANVSAVLNEANALLGANPVMLSGHSQRALAEAVKNALDNANNNLNFVQPEPCPFTFINVTPCP